MRASLQIRTLWPMALLFTLKKVELLHLLRHLWGPERGSLVSHITLIFRNWKKNGKYHQMSPIFRKLCTCIPIYHKYFEFSQKYPIFQSILFLPKALKNLSRTSSNLQECNNFSLCSLSRHGSQPPQKGSLRDVVNLSQYPAKSESWHVPILKTQISWAAHPRNPISLKWALCG